MTTDPLDPDLVYGGAGLLGQFNQAGIVDPADVHTAVRLGRIGGEADQSVLLAVALAVRAPRVGNVSVDLATIESVVVAGPDGEADLTRLSWPAPHTWIQRVAASPVVAFPAGGERPLQLSGSHLYLDRYWRDEVAVAADLLSRRGWCPTPLGDEELHREVDLLVRRSGAPDQIRAIVRAAQLGFAVISGGPGTGKTTAVARILALLHQHSESRPPLVALTAPTGRAAARLEEAVRAEAARMEVSGSTRQWLERLSGSTVHRLLGARPGGGTFRHNRLHRLPHDVVVVDEASMISLALMARLVEAVRPDARLLMVGDPEQLVSVEAGAVLADIVEPPQKLSQNYFQVGEGGGSSHPQDASGGESWSKTSRRRLPPASFATASPVASAPTADGLSSNIIRLATNHRFSGAVAELAEAVRAGDADRVLAVLTGRDPAVRWIAEEDPAGSALRPAIAGWAADIVTAARAGDAPTALRALRRNRVLCAHRDGPAGAAVWNGVVEGWIAELWPTIESEGRWYAGRPVLVTANDYTLQLFNGDSGVTVADGTGPVAVAFPSPAGPVRLVGASRLAGAETVFAMTVHKSQGSEFDEVALVLPSSDSRLLSRELFYTAITRARSRIVVVSDEEAVRAAVCRPIARASGLGARLWAE
ncbi:MAG: exodeoxyribonuclease V subunit alpha [Acidimicrobiales bacterium]|nr:exodeoxyribonuclease V subunit alpha [Acidimicrobiales bacterium]